MSDSLLTPRTAARQASLSITNSWSLFRFTPIELVMPSNHVIFRHPPSVFPQIRVFSNESVIRIRWPKYWNFGVGGVIPWRRKCQWKRYNRYGFDPWVGKISWRRAQQPTPVFLPENPMDREAWRATVQRVAKSWTWLSDQACIHTNTYFLIFW